MMTASLWKKRCFLLKDFVRTHVVFSCVKVLRLAETVQFPWVRRVYSKQKAEPRHPLKLQHAEDERKLVKFLLTAKVSIVKKIGKMVKKYNEVDQRQKYDLAKDVNRALYEAFHNQRISYFDSQYVGQPDWSGPNLTSFSWQWSRNLIFVFVSETITWPHISIILTDIWLPDQMMVEMTQALETMLMELVTG